MSRDYLGKPPDEPCVADPCEIEWQYPRVCMHDACGRLATYATSEIHTPLCGMHAQQVADFHGEHGAGSAGMPVPLSTLERRDLTMWFRVTFRDHDDEIEVKATSPADAYEKAVTLGYKNDVMKIERLA